MIAAYQRISRADGDLGKDGKDKSNSIENQKELIQRYISHKESLQNLPVMDFVDDGYTGSNFDRPGFQKMMDGVRSGEIDTIIVKDLSRFGRDYIGVGEYMEQIFPLLGVRLISINDNYDSSNYNGTTLGMDLVVSNLVNTMYCRDAGKKLRTANRVKWRKGISTASAAPFGYQFDPNRKGSYIIDPPAAKIVRRIFDLAILGLGTREIAMALNDENAPVPSVYNREHKAYGKETTYTIAPVILWDSSRVWKILTAYVYTGAMVLGKSQRLISGKKIIRIVPKGQQYITEGTHEAIVSREEFEKAQLVIRNNGHVVVIRQGALKGFVGVHPNWNGINAESIRSLCLSTYLPEEVAKLNKMAEMRSGKKLDMALPSDYLTVSGICFINQSSPVMTISKNGIRFSKACHTRLDNCEYVELLYHPILQVVILRKSDHGSSTAMHWRDNNDVHSAFSARAFSGLILQTLNWKMNCRYQCRGICRGQGNAKFLIFELDESRILTGKNQYEQENCSMNLKCRLYRSKWVQSITVSDVMESGQVVENPMIGAIPSRNEVQRELNDLLMSM